MDYEEKTATQALNESVDKFNQLFQDYYGRVWAAINDAIKNKDRYVNMILPNNDENDDDVINKIASRLEDLGYNVKLEAWDNSTTTRVIIDWKNPKTSKVEPEGVITTKTYKELI